MEPNLAKPPSIWTIEVTVVLPQISMADHNAFWDAFLCQVETNRVQFCVLGHGYIEADSPELAEAARSAFFSWLVTQAVPLSFALGPVVAAAATPP